LQPSSVARISWQRISALYGAGLVGYGNDITFRRVRIINAGTRTPLDEYPTGQIAQSLECFPMWNQGERALIEECIIEQPNLNPARETTVMSCYGVNSVTRNCYINMDMVNPDGMRLRNWQPRLRGLLPHCFVAHRSKITGDILTLRASHCSKMPRPRFGFAESGGHFVKGFRIRNSQFRRAHSVLQKEGEGKPMRFCRGYNITSGLHDPELTTDVEDALLGI
jgi:hypothetical protein